MTEIDAEVASFYQVLEQEIEDCAHDPDAGGLRLLALAKVVLSRLEEAGLVVPAQPSYFIKDTPRANSEVHAFSLDTDEDVLTLYYFIDVNNQTPRTVVKAEVESADRRLHNFAKLATAGELDADLEASQPVCELVSILKQRDPTSGTKLAYVVVTNGVVTERTAGESASDEGRDTWDLLRLFRTVGTDVSRESVDLTFDELGGALPCLVTPKNDSLQVLLTCIPGEMLAQLYERYRSRLLERNVRSFLQFTGKVNRGIRDTVLSEPERFLAYNNGISATAATVRLRDTGQGLAMLEAVSDFQIVNGGQTTASIASCLRRDKADLRTVFVPMKLTVVEVEKLDSLVPLISRYANTQNRIQEADFSANHPYHIELEKVSRQTWTPITPQMPRGTRWFYERSRGQYAVEKLRNHTTAGQRKFTQENPTAQRFSKTDLAKYLMSWDQFPQKVSLGAQKNFVEFMQQVENQKRPLPDLPEFHRIVGLALLYKRAEKLYGELDYKGYRANVVTYTVALMSHRLQRYMDWEQIWQQQAIPDEMVKTMKAAMIGVREKIINPPNQQNITEWPKKDACWSAVLQLPGGEHLPPPAVVKVEQPVLDIREQELVDAIHAVQAGVWLNIAKWAKQTDSLTAWGRKFSFNFGTQMATGKKPSLKQARVAAPLILESWRLGFRHEHITDPILTRVKTAVSLNEEVAA